MEPWIWVVLIAAVVVIAGFVAWTFMRKRRTEALQERFGPEYERAIGTYGDRARAEKELEARKERVERLHIRPLAPADQARFADAWRSVQARFVDDPAGAVTDADRLIGEVMQARGYPVGDFEQRATDISVEHPNVVTNYRAAHQIALASVNGQATTEELRQAMVYYRTLFEELIEAGQPARMEARR